jgi:hypothetical protein
MSTTNPTSVVNVFACKKDPSNAEEPHETKVSPEVLDMTHFDGVQVLTWQLKTEGYVFRDDPIVFQSCAAKVFSKALVSDDGRTASVLSQNNDGLAYTYTVFVKDPKTGHVSSVDPLVQNEGK